MEVCSKGLTRVGVVIAGESATLHADSKWVDIMTVGDVITVHNPSARMIEDEMHIYAKTDEDSHIFIQHAQHRGKVQLAEVFAGIAGWSRACDIYGEDVAYFVEVDEMTARMCARQQRCDMMKPEVFIRRALEGQIPNKAVILGDVNDPRVWSALCLGNVGTIMASPPCQPWCSRGSCSGLNSPEGQLLPTVGRWSGKTRMALLLVENVAGLPKHPDYAKVVRYIEGCGFHMALHGVHHTHQVLPLQRARWLATFVHSRIQLRPNLVQLAQSISFRDRAFADVCRSPSMSDADAIHCNISDEERLMLQIPDDARVMLSDFSLAPEWIQTAATSRDPDHVLQARVIAEDSPIAGIMARYGGQHKLPINLLKDKGLLTPLFHDSHGIRYFSPWEFLSALGYDETVVISTNLSEAWQLSGNGISVAHGWILLHKTHTLLGGLSPFHPQGTVHQQVQRFQQDAIKLSLYETMQDGDFWYLYRKDWGPPCKRIRLDNDIPPTVPFALQPEEVITTKEWNQVPIFLWMNDPRTIAVRGECYEEGLVTVQHEQKHWLMHVNVGSQCVVANIFTKGLPHAQQHHFEMIWHEGSPVHWDQQIQCRHDTLLVFAPRAFLITCKEESMQHQLDMFVDTTWTAKTATAYCAVTLGCSPDVVSLSNGPTMLRDQDYLCAYETVEWTIKFKARTPHYVEWSPTVAAIHDEGMEPVGEGNRRWVARHPVKKTIRTVVADERTSLGVLVQAMFPDLHANTPWKVCSNGLVVDPCIAANLWDKVELQWEGLRPFQVTKLCRVEGPCSVESPIMQQMARPNAVQLAIRSPFSAVLQHVWVHADLSIAEIAASYMLNNKAATTMMCLNGSMVVDPNTVAKECDQNGNYGFRIYPLLGGAKHEKLRQRVKNMLAAKGVPEDKLMDRLNGFASKIPLDRLTSIADADDEGFWNEIKSKASEAKYRLITPAELKAHQQTQRKPKGKGKTKGGEGASGSDKGKGKGKTKSKGKGKPVVNASDIVIDAQHFTSDQGDISLLELNRFGSDQAGLCVVTPQEAYRCMKTATKSCEPLALLVVGTVEQLKDFGCEVYSVPAHGPNQTPIIVQACLMQFGDEPVKFRMNVPSVTIASEATTNVEFCILREHVPKWSDTQVPLHYIGIHVSALRGSNLQGVWAIKACDETRKVVGHRNAHHWHGYFRISDGILDAVLARSGAAGIFLVPRSQDKQHDSRFSVVSLPCKSLSEVMAKAGQCTHSLGVIRMGEGYGIRTRREHVSSVRSNLLPETAYVDVANFEADEDLFTISHLPQMTREDVERAIRPQGTNRWTVAAKHDPEAEHMIINGCLAVIEKHVAKIVTTHTVSVVARETKVDSVVDPVSQTISTTSRVSEIQAHMQTQLEQTMDSKLQQAHARIESLSVALQNFQTENQKLQAKIDCDMTQLRDEQAFARQKLQEVESSVAASSNSIISQMGQMFATMQSSLEQTLTEKFNEPDKRIKLTEDKHDPFSTKS